MKFEWWVIASLLVIGFVTTIFHLRERDSLLSSLADTKSHANEKEIDRIRDHMETYQYIQCGK